MMISYVLLVSRQGNLRLAKWFVPLPAAAKAKLVRDVAQLTLARRARMCNVIEYKGRKVVYRRYASLFFICEVGAADNELLALELLHRYVEVLDQYFGNVCELDLIFNFQQAYAILDELLMAGEIQETSRKEILDIVHVADAHEKSEDLQNALRASGYL